MGSLPSRPSSLQLTGAPVSPRQLETSKCTGQDLMNEALVSGKDPQTSGKRPEPALTPPVSGQ